MPAFLQQAVNPTPTVDAQGTALMLQVTANAQTQEALPSPTLVPTSTGFTGPATNTATLPPTWTGTLAGTATPTASPVPPAASATPTLGVRFFGTRPPLVPSGRMIMMNRSHAEAYVSFQCINKEGTLSILEYPVGRWMEVRIPSGKCKYVAWVGGREFVGSFSLDTGGEKRIVFFKDRVTIK
jgi:hypothetical protein